MSLTPEQKHDALVQTAQAVPSIAAIWAYVAGITPERWLTYWGIAFLALQAGYLLWKWRRDVRRERNGQAPREN